MLINDLLALDQLTVNGIVFVNIIDIQMTGPFVLRWPKSSKTQKSDLVSDRTRVRTLPPFPAFSSIKNTYKLSIVSLPLFQPLSIFRIVFPLFQLYVKRMAPSRNQTRSLPFKIVMIDIFVTKRSPSESKEMQLSPVPIVL